MTSQILAETQTHVNTKPSTRSRPTDCEVILPRALGSERIVLAGLIEDGSLWAKVTSAGVRDEHFSSGDHSRAFSAIQTLVEQQAPVDSVGLAEALGGKQV